MKILIAFPFRIYPLKSGGALRSFHLLRELARHHEVEAILIDAGEDVIRAISRDLGSELNSLNIRTVDARSNDGTLWMRLIDRFYTFRLSGSPMLSSNSVTLAICRVLTEILTDRSIDVVILTTQELAICGTLVKRKSPESLRILDMHNVDHFLLKRALEIEGTIDLQKDAYKKLKKHESSLSKYANHLFACSDDDLKILLDINPSETLVGALVPNGVDCEAIQFDKSANKHLSKEILFCGSLSYLPNIDGLSWFHSKIWPTVKSRLVSIKLIVVGKGLDINMFPDLVADDSVELIGEVENLEPYYQRSGVSICPLRMGSGTRLKILESMAFGNPVVSTSIGCEGLNVMSGQNIVISDSEDGFARGVCELLSKTESFNSTRLAARDHVERFYDWKVIGRNMTSSIEHWAHQNH